MSEDLSEQKNSAAKKQLTEEILGHTEFLMETILTPQQRDRISRIHHSAQGLLAHLHRGDRSTQQDWESDNNENLMEKDGSPSLKVLLAEDNPFTQKLMSRLLTQNNHEVEVVANGKAVLEKLHEKSFDLILMDIRMPVMDGITAAEAIRSMEKSTGTPNVPIIAVTAMVEEEEKSRILESGINGYHGKPVRANVLKQEIQRVLQLNIDKTMNGPFKRSSIKTVSEETKPNTEIIVLDMERLLKTVDEDWALIREITDLFFSDSPIQMKRIRDAIDGEDTEELLEAAHSLKGAAGAFGKNQVYDLAFELEQLGRAKSITSAQEYYTQLTKALAVMEETLRAILTQNGEPLS